MEVGKAVKVVTEFLPNREDALKAEVEDWYQRALSFMREHSGQWVMVDQETHFHRSQLHKGKFRRFNQGSDTHFGDGWYQAEYRYPADGSCVMYGIWMTSAKSKVRRWLGL